MKTSASSASLYSLSSNSADPPPLIFQLLETESTSTIIKSLNEIFQESDTGGLKTILNQRNHKNQSALHVACFKHHLDVTHVLLNYGANPNVLDQDHQTPAFLVVLGLQNCNCEECTKKAVRCLTLLSYHGGIMDIPDAHKRTPLFLCAQNRFVVCGKALLLNGATPGDTPDGSPLLPILVEKMPSVLETVLDCSVKTAGNIILDDPKFIVEFDFSTVVPCLHRTCSMKLGEMRCLKSLLKRTHRNREIDDVHDDPVACVLRHPVVAVFMDIKWKALERWYAGFLMYQVLALLAYTGLIVASVFFDCPREKYTILRLQHLNITNQSNTMVSGTSCEPRPMSRFFAIILIINALLVLAHEVQRAVNYFKEYAKHLSYHVMDIMGSICVIFTAIIIATGADHTSPIYEWFYPISAFAVPVLWCQLFVQIGRLPKLAIYVEMLMKISANFCKTLAIYSFLLIGLAISYSILFNSNPQLRLFPFSMTKVISMLVGELDHGDLVNHSMNQDESPNHNLSTIQKVGSYFWYVCVVVMVTLVLMNLLVGLAVSDIQGIRANAEIYVIRRRIGYIAYIEKLIAETFVWRRFFNQSSKLSAVKRVISPVELMGFKITVFPNDPTYKKISKQTKLTIKSWIIKKSQSVPNFVKKCKGTSPDSSNTLTRKPTIKLKRDCNQRRILLRSQESTEITDTERLKQLEYQMVKLNDKLKMILENIMRKREPLNLSP